MRLILLASLLTIVGCSKPNSHTVSNIETDAACEKVDKMCACMQKNDLDIKQFAFLVVLNQTSSLNLANLDNIKFPSTNGEIKVMTYHQTNKK